MIALWCHDSVVMGAFLMKMNADFSGPLPLGPVSIHAIRISAYILTVP